MNILNLFDNWNTIKKDTHFYSDYPSFNDREIWWVKFGQNISSEIFGKGEDFLRPAIIFRKVFKDACIILPITSKIKTGSYYFNFKDKNNIQQCILLTQIKYIDARRLKYRISKFDKNEFLNLQESFIKFLTKK